MHGRAAQVEAKRTPAAGAHWRQADKGCPARMLLWPAQRARAMRKERAASACDSRDHMRGPSEGSSNSVRLEIKGSYLFDAHRATELLGEDAAHELHQRFSRFLENESTSRVRPGQLETCGQR